MGAPELVSRRESARCSKFFFILVGWWLEGAKKYRRLTIRGSCDWSGRPSWRASHNGTRGKEGPPEEVESGVKSLRLFCDQHLGAAVDLCVCVGMCVYICVCSICL